MRDSNAWAMVVVFAVAQGLVFSWQSTIVIALDSPHLSHRISEKFAANLGILVSFLAAAFSVAFALAMDRRRERRRAALAGLYLSSGGVFLLCTLLTEGALTIEDGATFKQVMGWCWCWGWRCRCRCWLYWWWWWCRCWCRCCRPCWWWG